MSNYGQGHVRSAVITDPALLACALCSATLDPVPGTAFRIVRVKGRVCGSCFEAAVNHAVKPELDAAITTLEAG